MFSDSTDVADAMCESTQNNSHAPRGLNAFEKRLKALSSLDIEEDESEPSLLEGLNLPKNDGSESFRAYLEQKEKALKHKTPRRTPREEERESIEKQKHPEPTPLDSTEAVAPTLDSAFLDGLLPAPSPPPPPPRRSIPAAELMQKQGELGRYIDQNPKSAVRIRQEMKGFSLLAGGQSPPEKEVERGKTGAMEALFGSGEALILEDDPNAIGGTETPELDAQALQGLQDSPELLRDLSAVRDNLQEIIRNTPKSSQLEPKSSRSSRIPSATPKSNPKKTNLRPGAVGTIQEGSASEATGMRLPGFEPGSPKSRRNNTSKASLALNLEGLIEPRSETRDQSNHGRGATVGARSRSSTLAGNGDQASFSRHDLAPQS